MKHLIINTLKSIINFFLDYLPAYFWLFLARIVKSFKIFNYSSLIIENYTDLIFLPPQPFTNKLLFSNNTSFDKSYSGPNLDLLLKNYLSNNSKFNVSVLDAKEILHLNRNGETAVVTWISCNPKGLSYWTYLIKVVFFALKLKRRNIPVISFLPDTYFPDAASVSTILTTLTGGVNIFLQSSSSEATSFGYPRARSPIFWTFPESRYKSLLENKKVSDKENQILLAGGSSGGLKRLPLMERLSDLFLNLQIQPIYTNGSLTWDEYTEILKKSKFLATTNYTQDGFYIGPKKFKRIISPTTTTGRTWDAFAAECVLITNQTKVLDEIGFIPGEDYIDIETCFNLFLDNQFNDDIFRIIAENGHRKFLDAIKKFRLF